MTVIAGLIGIFGFAAFLGFMLWWVPAPPLIAIVVLVSALMAYDWVQTVRFGDSWSRPKR
jgi:hypothetical protein